MSLNAMMSPPITSASRMASVVTTAGLPCVTALMTRWLRPWPLGGPAVSSAAEAGPVATPAPGPGSWVAGPGLSAAPGPGSAGRPLTSSLMSVPLVRPGRRPRRRR